MNPGQVVGFLWDLAVWFFILSVFVLPIVMNAWRRREKADAKRTEETLKATRFDRSGLHEMDAL